MLLGGKEEGGLEQHIVHLSNQLSANYELQISVIAHEKYRQRFNNKINFYGFAMDRSRRNPWFLMRLVLIIRSIAPDVIHAHASKASSILATIKNYIPGKKLATIHSQKKKTSMYQQMDAVIGVSKAVLKDIKSTQTTVIYNGVPEGFNPLSNQSRNRRELGIDNDLPIALFVGRLVAVKGADILLKAWKNIDANLLFVGEGEDLIKLKKIAVQLDNKFVHFLGHRKDVGEIMRLVDLTIISSYREGFSYVVAESLLMETPIISTNVPVANEVLPSHMIVETGDIESLHQLIAKTLSRLHQLDEEFQPLYQYARDNFSEEKMLNKTFKLYQKLISQ